MTDQRLNLKNLETSLRERTTVADATQKPQQELRGNSAATIFRSHNDSDAKEHFDPNMKGGDGA